MKPLSATELQAMMQNARTERSLALRNGWRAALAWFRHRPVGAVSRA